MRRQGRIILDALTTLSLLLCLAFAALWVRGYWRWDVLGWTRPARPDAESGVLYVWSAGGGAAVYAGFCSPASVGRLTEEGWYWHATAVQPIPYAGGWPVNRWGLAFDTLRRPHIRWARVIFPAWLAAALFAAPPGHRLARALRRRRRARHCRCANCGYDLRATPGRCPECGTAPAAARN